MKASPGRIGTDIILVADIQDWIDRFGSRFLNRIFTLKEQEYCKSRTSTSATAQCFAARFAAKEATIKVLRPEIGWLDWCTIEVERYEQGYCDIVLHQEAAELARRRGIVALSLSMSHEPEYATAVVIADFS